MLAALLTNLGRRKKDDPFAIEMDYLFDKRRGRTSREPEMVARKSRDERDLLEIIAVFLEVSE